MGTNLIPIAVDLEKVGHALGSKNKRLLGAVVKKYSREFRDLDDMAAEFFADEGIDDSFTIRDALGHMILGQEYREEPELGFMYGYALEYLCRQLGKALSFGWRFRSSSTLEWDMDRALAAAGVPEDVLRISRLTGRGCPVPLPEIPDDPYIGYMLQEEMPAALAAFDEAKLAAVESEDARGWLAELRGWLQTCRDSGRDLICFYG
jgi:hypothetical protein